MGDYFSSTPVDEVIGKEGQEYVLVLFSAQYCPPCQKLVEPLKKFYEEYSKDGKSEIILINCDAREKEYSEHLKTMDWMNALPFNVDPSVIEALEDAANADVVPKLSVFNIARGFEKPVVDDIKGPILKCGEVADAITKINTMILDGEEAMN